MYPESLDADARDQLAVVEFDALEVVAVVEGVQRRVSQQRAVVQLEDRHRLVGARPARQQPDALVRHQLAVRQALHTDAPCPATPPTSFSTDGVVQPSREYALLNTHLETAAPCRR